MKDVTTKYILKFLAVFIAVSSFSIVGLADSYDPLRRITCSKLLVQPVDNRMHTGKEFQNLNGLGWYDNLARQMDAILGRFTTPDPLAEKYYNISPYAHCANNALKYIDPDGMEWIWSSNNNDMRWDDNVKSEKDQPKGYVYIGNNKSLLSFFNFPTSTQSQSSNKIGFVAFDTNVGMHMINVKEKSNVSFTVNVVSDEKNITSNNKFGKTFNGVDIKITNESSNSGTDGRIGSSSSVGAVTYGNDKYQQYLTSLSGYNFRTTGTILTQTTINIPKENLSPISNLSNVSVSGSWWVSRSEGRTPVVILGLTPIPLTYKHQWK